MVPLTETAVELAYGSTFAPVAVEVIAPEVLSAAAAIVPVKVGEAESTMLPVPVTALERVTPPYVSALTSVSAPLVAKLDVAVAPKYAGPYEEKRVVDA